MPSKKQIFIKSTQTRGKSKGICGKSHDFRLLLMEAQSSEKRLR